MTHLSPDRAAQVREAFEAGRQAGKTREEIVASLATSLGVSAESAGRYVRQALKTKARRGELGTRPVLPGFEITRTSAQVDADGEVEREWIEQKPERGEVFEAPAGHVVKGVSALLDQDGREVIKWVKTREGQRSPEEIAEILKASLADVPAAAPRPRPSAAVEELLTLYPCNDWHIGMYAWGREAGQSWDLAKAEATIGAAVEDLVAISPYAAQAVVLVGGDLLHTDNQDNRTAKSGNALDVDGRYQKVLAVANRLLVRTVDLALDHHQRVLVRVLKGNHDEHAAVGVAYFLQGYYRNEPRVTVDVDPSLFWWFRWGKVLLGSTHGHTVKPEQLAGIMAHRRAEDWGKTTFRYVHTFHLHHKRVLASEGGGVTTEVHQAPIPQDAWHFGAGFLSGRSLQAITYHQEYGEIGRGRIALLDA
jgi:Calcineurin-like phosphoesterase